MTTTTPTFRIFVSSTFSDLKAERNALQEHVFPRLRELCERHGCRFQAIDLRWGVSEEAGLDQQTMKICLTEIARCQRVTPRPNFIILLGDRYGWRPLPYAIPAAEMERLLPYLSPGERKILLWNDAAATSTRLFSSLLRHLGGKSDDQHGWYRLDRNAVPPEYVLLPRTGKYVNFTTWHEQVELPLRDALFRAATAAGFTKAQMGRYAASATEQEIVHGALTVSDADQHVFAFFRQINNLGDVVKDLLRVAAAGDYVDQLPDGQWDRQAYNQLQALKGDTNHGTGLRGVLSGHTYEYSALWRDGALTTDHIAKLCEDAYSALAKTILTEIQHMEAIDPLIAEAAEHERFGAERARYFVGRATPLARIAEYVKSSSSDPLVVYGPSGIGKSALMAEAAARAHRTDPGCKLIARFIGATPSSSNGRAVLTALCQDIYRSFDLERQKTGELQRVTGIDEQAKQQRSQIEEEYRIPDEMTALAASFKRFLAKIPDDARFVLFLDALDQLDQTDPARQLSWLPDRLSANVKIVVSLSSEAHDCLTILQRIVSHFNLIELEPLSTKEGKELLREWLAEAGRTLQPYQEADVLDKFGHAGLPLYLRLAFNEARLWRSYEDLPRGADAEPGLSATIEGIIRDLYHRLSQESHHGQELVAGSLAYLSAARFGLTEDELLDVLSRDPTVMDDFRRRSPKSPPAGTLPVVTWVRLLGDLEPYLSTQNVDNTSVLTFYHRQLAEIARADYLAGQHAQARSRRLADYFLQARNWHRTDATRFPNRRKTSETPYLLAQAAMWSDLSALLTDLDFVEAKLAAGASLDLCQDYERSLAVAPAASVDRGALEDFQRFITRERSVLHRHPALTFQYAANQMDSTAPARVARQRWQSGEEKRPWLEWANKTAQYDFCLLTTPMGGEICSWSPDGKWIAVASGKDIRCLEAKTGAEHGVLRGHESRVTSMAWSPDGAFLLSASDDKTCRIWDVETNNQVWTTMKDPQGEVPLTCIWSPDGRRIAWGRATGAVFVDFTAPLHKALRYNLGVLGNSATVVAIESDSRPLASELWSPDGRHLLRSFVTGGDRKLAYLLAEEPGNEKSRLLMTVKGDTQLSRNCYAWAPDSDRFAFSGQVVSLSRKSVVCNLEGFYYLNLLIAWSPDGTRIAAARTDRHLQGEGWGGAGTDDIRIWDASSGKVVASFVGHLMGTTSLSWSPDSKRLASTGWAPSDLKIWDVAAAEYAHRQTTQSTRQLPSHDKSAIWDFAWSPDYSKFASVGWDGNVKIWTVPKCEIVTSRPGGFVWLFSCAWSPDGSLLATGTFQNVVLWDTRHYNRVYAFAAHEKTNVGSCLFSVEGRRLLTVGQNDPTPRLWDIARRTLMAMLSGHSGSLTGCAWSADGMHIATCASDQTLRIWDGLTGRQLATWSKKEDITGCLWSADGRNIAVGLGNKCIILDSVTLHEIRAVPVQLNSKSAWSPDGRYFVVGPMSEGKTAFYSVETGQELASIVGVDEFCRPALGLNGSSLLISDEMNDIRLFRLVGAQSSAPMVSAVYLFRHDLRQWDQNASIRCQWCGVQFLCPDVALSAISQGAARHNHQRLNLHCPGCDGELLLNPFVIDLRRRL